MLKKLCICVLALTCLPCLALTQLTGTVKNGDGSNFYGRIVLTLPFAGATDSSGNVVAPTAVSYPISNGAILSTNPTIIANGDIAAPIGTYYAAALYDSYGGLIETFNVVIPSGSTFNIGAAVQTAITTPNVSFVNPAGLNSNNVWGGTNTYNQVSTFNSSAVFNGPVSFNGGVSGISGFLTSFAGRTASAAVPTTGDYTVAQVTGAAPLASPALTGAPTTPTPTISSGIANKSYVDSQITLHSQAFVEFTSGAMAPNGGGEWSTQGTQSWGTTLPNSSYKMFCSLSCPGGSGSCNALAGGYQADIYWDAKTTTNFHYTINDDHSGSNGATYTVDCMAAQ